MSYDVTEFKDYVSRENEYLTGLLFAGGDTAKFARFMSGIKGKTSVPKLSGGATLQAGFCKSPKGETKVSEVSIEVFPFTVFEEFCEDDLQTKFPNMVLAPGSSNHDSPKTWKERIVELKTASINEQLELMYWQGDELGVDLNLFDGFIKIVDANGTAIDGNENDIPKITKGNVIKLVDNMYSRLPAKVKRSGEATIVVGDDVFDLYILAVKKENLYAYNAEHDNGLYKIGGSGAMLRRVYGLNETERMFAGRGSDFIVGNDVNEEEVIMKVWYDETPDKVYFRAKGKAGVQVDNISEIVEFSTQR